MHNILICQDLVRLYNRKVTTKSCLKKIDLKKSYDSIEWGSVEEMLHAAMNFPMKFIKWVMTCISTTQYSITLNGGLYENIQGKRGLRQSDPISLLIFVIYMEYFSRIMKRVADIPGFEYHTKCKGLRLNHLCFVDDVFLLCKGTYQSYC